MNYLIAIVGPTAVGKTDFAIQLASHFKCSILSADSRQFYREMNIGTAKPTERQLNKVAHYFVNNLSIEQEYSAGIFEKEALEKLEMLFDQYRIQLVVGGSGLYIDALCYGFDSIPNVPNHIREELNQAFARDGLTKLLAELALKDIDYFERVDRNNPQRIVRALEVIRFTGIPYSAFRKKEGKARPFKIISIGLEAPREILYQRINERVDKMFNSGLLEEARSLYPLRSQVALQTVGYQELFDHFDGLISLEEAVRLIKRNTRRYAKRQLTWFKRDKDIYWFAYNEFEECERFLEKELLN